MCRTAVYFFPHSGHETQSLAIACLQQVQVHQSVLTLFEAPPPHCILENKAPNTEARSYLNRSDLRWYPHKIKLEHEHF